MFLGLPDPDLLVWCTDPDPSFLLGSFFLLPSARCRLWLHCCTLYTVYSVGLSWNYKRLPQREWFIEDQAFLPLYDLAPPPLPHPLSHQLPLFLNLPVCRWSSLWMGERGGGGRGAKSYDGEKEWSSNKHSIRSGITSCSFNSVWHRKAFNNKLKVYYY